MTGSAWIYTWDNIDGGCRRHYNRIAKEAQDTKSEACPISGSMNLAGENITQVTVDTEYLKLEHAQMRILFKMAFLCCYKEYR